MKKKLTYESPFWCGPIIEPRDWRSLPDSELTRAERNMMFCERYLRVPEGTKIGQPIRFDEFQERFFYSVYDNPHGTKRAFLSMARKNGKTALVACIVLVHLIGPESVRNSHIQSGALSRDQAAAVYKYASKMVELSPNISRLVKCTSTVKTIHGLPMGVTFQSTAAEAKTNMGGSPILAILDETGQIKGPQDDFVDSVVTSQGAYENSMLMVISTQASSDADLLSVWLDDAKESKDPQIVAHVYTAPAGCDLMDEESWKASNPALGEFRSESDLRMLCSNAKRMPASANNVRNLNLNQRVSTASPFVSRDTWLANGGELDLTEAEEIYGGLDLSSHRDLTSFALVGKVGDKWGARVWFWTPEKGLDEREKQDRSPYLQWVHEGYLKTTPRATVDYDYVVREIAEILDDYPQLAKVGFDRWRIDIFKKAAEEISLDIPLVPFGQGYKDMSPAIDTFEKLLLNNEFCSGDNPVLTMCAANAVITFDPAKNRKFDKHKATGRIDGMVAVTMALGVAPMEFEAPEKHNPNPKVYFM